MMNLTPRINRVERNLLIDGGMQIWPEGTTRTFTAGSSGYGACMMRVYNDASGAVTLTNTRQSSVPSNTSLIYSNQISKTASGTLAAGNAHGFIYNMQGYNTEDLWLNEFSVIFCVKSSVASNRSLSLRNGTASHSYVRQYNIGAVNTWEMKALRFDELSTCPGTVDRTNGLGMQFLFNIVAGSTFQTSTLNAWQAGNKFSGIGEDTTWLTGTTHDFSIAGVMILPGNWEDITSAQYQFVRAGKDFDEELDMTLSYFEKSYDLATNPGTVTDVGNATWRKGAETSTLWRATVEYGKRKFRTATVTLYNNRTGVAGQVDIGNALSVAGSVIQSAQGGFSVEANGTTGNPHWNFHWVSDARF